jgi:hypothetical protein
MMVAAITALALSIPTAAVATVDLSLPALTGPNAVGRNTLALTDRDRADPWGPESGARQLMLTLYRRATEPAMPSLPARVGNFAASDCPVLTFMVRALEEGGTRAPRLSPTGSR